MSANGDQFFAAWLKLASAERDEVAKRIKEYLDAPQIVRDVISQEQLNERRKFEKGASINFGPVPGGECPMCGK